MFRCLGSYTERRIALLKKSVIPRREMGQSIALDSNTRAKSIPQETECRWHSSHAQESGLQSWDCRKQFDLPAIIGRELLFLGAAQDVMHMTKTRGNIVEAALSQPITSFLREPASEKLDSVESRTSEMPSDKTLEALESSISGNPNALVFSVELSTKRTYQPSTIIRKRRHGFLSRLKSVGGRRVLSRRRLKGRRKMTG